MKTYLFLVSLALLCFLTELSSAQQDNRMITGKVTEKMEGSNSPLVGANIYWLGTTTGTISGTDGTFSIQKIAGNNNLVVSFTGFRSDTINVEGIDQINIELTESIELDEVQVVKRQKSIEFSSFDPIKIEKIGEKELLKAACCNLSESFETNPSVDVAFTDAITGTRQIQMLGLAGPYTQITRENMPDVRGLSAIQGLTYTPGPWIEGLQLNKGAGSVANGFESIAGQINVELRKPEESERLYFNFFANEDSRLEANLNLSHKFTDYTSTALLLHAKNNSAKHDRNDDGFVDHPLGNQLIFLNRWKFFGNDGWRLQFGLKGTYINMFGGDMNYTPKNTDAVRPYWGMENETNRAEAFVKIGKVSIDKPYQSFGLQMSATNHEQNSLFGLKNYNGRQSTGYSNFLFQSIIGTTAHQYKTGASFIYDKYDESLDSILLDRTEIIPGVFFEYTFTHEEKLSLVTGLRYDHHNTYGSFLTPRLHARYAFTPQSVLRFSAGRGQRTANLIAENSSVLASSRTMRIGALSGTNNFELKPEVAWNTGLNFTQKFRLDYRDGAISLDFYRTEFQNQVVVDLDMNPQEVHFYNLDGKSFSNSMQIQADYELIRRLDVRLAYRVFDVHTDYQQGRMQRPMVAKHRAFLNLAYNTRNLWSFDYTLQWQGRKRIPNTSSNPTEYQLSEYSPSFFLMNAQVTKKWKEKFEVYIGGENLLGFKQKNAILANDNPFGPYFDASLIWGPVFGRMIYAGVRLRIKSVRP